MWEKLQGLFTASSLAAARNVLMALAGVGAATGLIGATQAQDLVNSIMAIGTALGTLIAAISAFVLVLMPVIAAMKSTLSAQRKAVSLQPHTMVVQMQDGASTVLGASKIAAMPEVTQVTASPRVADASTSAKVVAAADAVKVNTTT
jgi:hypothetical protein